MEDERSISRSSAGAQAPAQRRPDPQFPSNSIPVDPSTINAVVRENSQSSMKALDFSGRVPGQEKPPTDDPEGEGSVGDEEAPVLRPQAMTAKNHVMIREMTRDLDTLLVLVFTSDMQSYMRADMNRFDLLGECRKSILDFDLARVPVKTKEAAAGGRSLNSLPSQVVGASLQLRDIRTLQGVREPAFFVRRGAIVLSLEPLNAIVTHDKAYVVVPEGADGLLGPLLHRVSNSQAEDKVPMPFEFVAVEALLVTQVNSYRRSVNEYTAKVRQILRAIRREFSNLLLNDILQLKKKMDEVYEAIRGGQEAIEEVQRDDDAMALMFLSAMYKDPEGYEMLRANRKIDVMQIEVLLDAYALEFEGLANDLRLLEKEIDANEELLKFKLDKARNKLIRLDVMFGMVSAFLGAATCIGSFYGMNLQHGAYTDGTVKPGAPSGAFYEGPWEGGPSWEFFAVTVYTSALTIFLIFLTWILLYCFGLLRT